MIRAGRPDGSVCVKAFSIAVGKSHGPKESGTLGSNWVVLLEATLLMIERAKAASAV